MNLNLGCGNKAKEGYLGVDKHPCDAAGLRCDITRRLPFADGSVAGVWMDNVIEHVADIPALMAEIVRVCRAGAEVEIITPHFTSLASWRDPTHCHHLSWFSFDHFEKKDVAHYMGGGLTVAARKLSFASGLSGLLGRLLFKISPAWYESKWCFLFRASTLRVTLRVEK